MGGDGSIGEWEHITLFVLSIAFKYFAKLAIQGQSLVFLLVLYLVRSFLSFLCLITAVALFSHLENKAG